MARVTRDITELDPGAIAASLARVREAVDAACARAGRKRDEVEILTATKYVSLDGLEALHAAGIRLIGENRARDLVARHRRYGDRFTYDFIGHLQSNKVRQVLPRVRLIHSINTLSAVQEIERRAESVTNVLLEVNIGQEASKYGIIPSEVDRFLEEAAKFTKVNFTGLMTMPPLATDPEAVRPAFAELRRLAHGLSRKWAGRYHFKHLSMGTSNDFVVAVEEGATVIRVGSILFG